MTRVPGTASDLSTQSSSTAMVGARQQIAIGNYIAQAQDHATAILTVNEVFRATEPKTFNDEAIAAALACLAKAGERLPEPRPLPLGSRMPLMRNPLFVGRRTDLLELARRLTGEAASPVTVVAITGGGGQGKTQLAVEFAHRFGQFFPGGVFWFSFANRSGVPSEIAASAPGILTIGSDFREMSVDAIVQVVQQAWQSAIPRLLIFDNCEHEQLLQTWRPTSGGCRVLLTSRRARWDPSLAVVPLPLQVFKADESVALLHHHFREHPPDRQILGQIADELGHLPLALHLAGSFLSRYRHTKAGDPEVYLSQLRSPEIFKHRSFEAESISPTGHDHNLARTFELSRAQLVDQSAADRVALRLLDRICFFAAGEIIPRGLVLASILENADELDAEDGLGRLANLGLIDIEEGGSIRVHRLVAAYARNMVTDVIAQQAVEITLLATFSQLQDAYRVLQAETLQAHLVAVVGRARGRGDALATELCILAGNHFRIAHDFETAQPYLERALAICEADPSQAESLPRAVNDFGLVLALQGGLDRAEALYKRAIPLWQKAEDWPNLAATLDNLAQLLADRGLFREAREVYELALAIRERVLGPDSPWTAITLHNLGELVFADSDYQKALEHHSRALAIRERVLDPEHPSVAVSLASIGAILLCLGDAVSARKHMERALSIREKTLGPKDPRTTRSKQAMSALSLVEGNAAAADAYLKEALQAGHQSTVYHQSATMCNNIGLGMWQRGDYAKARLFYGRALEFDRAASPPRSLDKRAVQRTSVVLLNNLGKVLEDQGQASEARAIFERAYRMHLDSGDTCSVLAARIFHNLGSFLRSQGELKRARELLSKALKLRLKMLGKQHRDTAITWSSLGLLACDQGAAQRGRRLVNRAVRTLKKLRGDDDPDLARSLHDLGIICARQGDTSAAAEAFRRAMRIREKLFPNGHPETAATARELGKVMRDAGEISAARGCWERALQIARAVFGSAHPRTLQISRDLEGLN